MVRAMQDSGAIWIGELPATWELRRFKNAGGFQTGQDHKSLSAGSVPVFGSSSEPFAWVDRAFCFRKAIAIGRKGTIDRPFVIQPGFWAVDTCMFHTVLRTDFSLEYLGYWSNIVPWKEISTQTALPSLTQTDANNVIAAFPPIHEQRRIAAWLDLQTSRIDKRRELLGTKRELLGELRTSLIYEAVTKGASWNVETGQASNLPLGWIMLRIKDVAKLRSGNFIAAERIEPAGVFPVYGGNGLRGYTDTFTHSGTFALVGRQGALCGNVNYAKGKFWATEHAVVVRPKRQIAVRWFGEMLSCMNLNQYATASAQPGLSVEVVVNKFLPFPPFEVQQALVGYLDQKTPLIDRQITLIDQLDDLLKQQRKAIIHEAVTGKIDLSQESSFQKGVRMTRLGETLPN